MFFKALFAGTYLAVVAFSNLAHADCPVWCGADDPECEKARARGECEAANNAGPLGAASTTIGADSIGAD
jgi:hypothetical protein